LNTIDQQSSNPCEKLRQYAGLYESVLSNKRMCLCGMLAAEYATLPAPMQRRLTSFFDANERWLTGVLECGLRAGAFRFSEPANERARVLLGALIEASERAGFWTLEAGIFPENAASIALHESLGFELVGVRRRVGQMPDGRWRDVRLYERRSPTVGVGGTDPHAEPEE